MVSGNNLVSIITARNIPKRIQPFPCLQRDTFLQHNQIIP